MSRPQGLADVVSQPADNLVDSHASNQRHHIVVETVVFSRPEHGHDMRVVQVGGGLGLSFETLTVFLQKEGVLGQDLQSHMASQRLLLRLIDDAHSAAPDFTHDAKIAQMFRNA